MATHEDAMLIAQLLQWGAQNDLEDAFGRIHAEEFDPDTATAQDPAVRKVLGFGEVLGTFVKQNVLDRDLVLDLYAVRLAWRRVGPAALKMRERSGEPRLYENFEALASMRLAAVG